MIEKLKNIKLIFVYLKTILKIKNKAHTARHRQPPRGRHHPTLLKCSKRDVAHLHRIANVVTVVLGVELVVGVDDVVHVLVQEHHHQLFVALVLVVEVDASSNRDHRVVVVVVIQMLLIIDVIVEVVRVHQKPRNEIEIEIDNDVTVVLVEVEVNE